MKALSAALSLCLALFIAPAQAQTGEIGVGGFTPPEKTEVLKLVGAIMLISSAIEGTAQAIEDDSERFWSQGEREQYARVLGGLRGGQYSCRRGFLAWLWVRQNKSKRRDTVVDASGERPDNIVPAQTWVSGCHSGIENNTLWRINGIVGLEGEYQQVVDALALIDSIDWSLPYREPLPASWPRIIGPHGDYDRAQDRAGQASKYMAESAVTSIFRAEPVWPIAAISPYALSIKAIAQAVSRWVRGTSMTAGIPTPEDQAIIDGDFAAGTPGFRPPEFFAAMLQHEIFMTRQTGTNFRGRVLEPGISAAFHTHQAKTLSFMGILIDEVQSDAAIQQIRESGGGGGWGSDFANAWAAIDEWSGNNLAFFFEIPPPPGGGGAPPDLVCGVGTVLADPPTDPQSCVSTVVCPPLPPEKVLSHSFIVNGDSLTLAAECSAP